ncbi:MAG: hypothetical protein RMJ98_06325 [Myxococcales bacterium]|nr:hypothetical protein [Polyangiaceae bacterium]MDW8248904.1 hypothetical protein [Myxococcales bacterium]
MSFPPRTETRDGLLVTVSGHSIKFEGVLHEQNAFAWLYPFLLDVHQIAVEAAMPEVIFDIRQLTYANAAFWRSFALWLQLLKPSPHPPYRVRLLFNPAFRWQKLGLPPLARLSGSRLVIR